jgi:hypothetical protein
MCGCLHYYCDIVMLVSKLSYLLADKRVSGQETTSTQAVMFDELIPSFSPLLLPKKHAHIAQCHCMSRVHAALFWFLILFANIDVLLLYF